MTKRNRRLALKQIDSLLLQYKDSDTLSSVFEQIQTDIIKKVRMNVFNLAEADANVVLCSDLNMFVDEIGKHYQKSSKTVKVIIRYR